MVRKASDIWPQGQGGVCFTWSDLSLIRLLWIPLSHAMTMSPFTITGEAEVRQVMRESQALWVIKWEHLRHHFWGAVIRIKTLAIYENVQILSDQQRTKNSWRKNISLWLASCSSTLTGKWSRICAYKSEPLVASFYFSEQLIKRACLRAGFQAASGKGIPATNN